MRFIRLLSASLVLAFLFVHPVRAQSLEEVATSPATLGVCAMADAATTAFAVSHGLGFERNPLLAPSVNAHHFGWMVLSKLALVGLIWWAVDKWGKDTATDTAVGAANVATCGVAINNALVILK